MESFRSAALAPFRELNERAKRARVSFVRQIHTPTRAIRPPQMLGNSMKEREVSPFCGDPRPDAGALKTCLHQNLEGGSITLFFEEKGIFKIRFSSKKRVIDPPSRFWWRQV